MPDTGPATADKAQQPQARAPESAGSDSEFLPPGAMGILELQRKAGNRAVTAAIASGSMWSMLGSPHLPVQLMPAVQRWAGNRAAVSLQRQRPTVQTESSEGPTLTLDESETEGGAAPVQRRATVQRLGATLQRHGTVQRQVTVQRQKKKEIEFVPIQVRVEKEMTPAEFEAMALRQIFGAARPNARMVHYTNVYDAKKSPYLVRVDVQVFKQQRSKADKDRGISVDEGGGVTGADERAKTFQDSAETAEKGEVLSEIDRRYYEAIGAKSETKIKPDEKGKAELWKSIRDEVLFQQEYIKKLPPKVQELIKEGVQGRTLTPADYDRFFAIAKKIERMPAAQVSDMASKVTASTSDLATFDASIDQYLAQAEARAKKVEARQGLKDKLAGLGDTYKRYLEWYRYPPGKYANQKGRMRTALEAELRTHGFDSIEAFEGAIEGFIKDFELGSLEIANDLLDKYAGKLFRESTRYTDQKEVSALHGKLGGVRTSQAEYEKYHAIYQAHVNLQAKRGRDRVFDGPGAARASDAYKKAEAAKAVRQSELKTLSTDYPIFAEDGLPEDQQIDKSALSKATEQTLGGLLQRHISARGDAVKKAREEMKDEPEVIYKMTKLMPTFYAKQGITPGSIYDLAITEKMKRDAVARVFKGIALAIVAIAIAVVTFGTATPALLAAGAGIAGAGLGVYQAYESYQEYAQEKNLAAAGFADDPSIIWVVIAVAGAAADMGAAVKAVGALGKAAKALEAGGELKAFTAAVRQLEKTEEITADVARAAEKAGAARKGLQVAKSEFKSALKQAAGRLYTFPGPLTDPDVLAAVGKMARQAIKTKLYDLEKFIAELKLMRAEEKLGEMSAEEIAKAKQAWAEAKALQAAEDAQYDKLLKIIGDETKLNALIGAAGDATKLEHLLTIFKESELTQIFAAVKDPTKLALAVEHMGAETTAGTIRQWLAKGKADRIDLFLERAASGVGKELAEKAPVGAKSLIIDSQTVIALMKDADPVLAKGMSAGEKAIVADIKALPAGTELRVGNVTVGEVGSGVINAKGVPLNVARDSPEYNKVLKALADKKVGGTKGIADRGVVADAMFAQMEPGVVPKLASADPGMVKGLARMATVAIDVDKIGYAGIVAKYGSTGFEVTIEGRKLIVLPLHGS